MIIYLVLSFLVGLLIGAMMLIPFRFIRKTMPEEFYSFQYESSIDPIDVSVDSKSISFKRIDPNTIEIGGDLQTFSTRRYSVFYIPLSPAERFVNLCLKFPGESPVTTILEV